LELTENFFFLVLVSLDVGVSSVEESSDVTVAFLAFRRASIIEPKIVSYDYI